jgi:hypothetical protein
VPASTLVVFSKDENLLAFGLADFGRLGVAKLGRLRSHRLLKCLVKRRKGTSSCFHCVPVHVFPAFDFGQAMEKVFDDLLLSRFHVWGKQRIYASCEYVGRNAKSS